MCLVELVTLCANRIELLHVAGQLSAQPLAVLSSSSHLLVPLRNLQHSSIYRPCVCNAYTAGWSQGEAAVLPSTCSSSVASGFAHAKSVVAA